MLRILGIIFVAFAQIGPSLRYATATITRAGTATKATSNNDETTVEWYPSQVSGDSND